LCALPKPYISYTKQLISYKQCE